jgi:hypothetical protein
MKLKNHRADLLEAATTTVPNIIAAKLKVLTTADRAIRPVRSLTQSQPITRLLVILLHGRRRRWRWCNRN